MIAKIIHKMTCKIRTSRVNFCVTQFATRFTYVSRQYQTKNRKQLLKLRKNFSEIVVSKKNIKKLTKILRNKSETNIMDILSNFSPN